jgi:hypothetical protein
MSPLEVTGIAFLVYLVLRLIVQPLLAGSLLAANSPNLVTVGALGAVECLSSFALLMTLSAAFTVAAFFALQELATSNHDILGVAGLERLIGYLRHLQSLLNGIHREVAWSLFAILVAGTAYFAWRARRLQVGDLVEKERVAQFQALARKRAAGELEELPPTATMTMALDQARRIEAFIGDFNARRQRPDATLALSDQRVLDDAREKLNEWMRLYTSLDLDRRVSAKIDPSRIQFGRTGGFWGTRRFVCQPRHVDGACTREPRSLRGRVATPGAGFTRVGGNRSHHAGSARHDD